MKYFLIIISFFWLTISTYATVCDFWWYEIKEDQVYWVTYCDNKHLDIIPFADYKTFILDKNNIKLASDNNYNFIENYVVSHVDDSDFVKLNEYIFTDRKNIFIKTQDKFLYISKYKFDTKIFTIYDTDNWGRFLLKVAWNIYNINIRSWYISYSWGIHLISNIEDINNLEQISPFIFTDWINFYITFLNNQKSKWMNFGIDIPTADFFWTNKKQFFQINEMWKRLMKSKFSDENISKLELTYNKLQLTKNPYINTDEHNKYWEFFIKKELLLYYLWIIINN